MFLHLLQEKFAKKDLYLKKFDFNPLKLKNFDFIPLKLKKFDFPQFGRWNTYHEICTIF